MQEEQWGLPGIGTGVTSVGRTPNHHVYFLQGEMSWVLGLVFEKEGTITVLPDGISQAQAEKQNPSGWWKVQEFFR